MTSVMQLISSRGYYGAESMLVSLSAQLARNGCRVSVCVFRDRRDPHLEVAHFAERYGLPVHLIDCTGRWDRSAVAQLRRIALHHGVDVLHTHGYKANLYGLAALWRSRTALVATCHNWPAGERVLGWYARLDRTLLRFFHRIGSPSPLVVGSLERAHIPGSKLACIPNGVEVERFASAPATLRALVPGSPVIGFVGRLVPGKGGQVLLAAAPRVLREFPQAMFWLVGEGPEREAWQAQARELAIADRVVFGGARSDMPEVYAAMDILALPSMEEAMPMCVLEAMAAGKPVVATRVGAVPEVVLPGRTGTLVDAGDVDATAAALLELCANPGRAGEFGRAARELIRQRFSSEAMTARYLDLYREAVRARTSRLVPEALTGEHA